MKRQLGTAHKIAKERPPLATAGCERWGYIPATKSCAQFTGLSFYQKCAREITSCVCAHSAQHCSSSPGPPVLLSDERLNQQPCHLPRMLASL
jgi:hypothetical protein